MSIAYSLQPIINRDSRHDIGEVELRFDKKSSSDNDKQNTTIQSFGSIFIGPPFFSVLCLMSSKPPHHWECGYRLFLLSACGDCG